MNICALKEISVYLQSWKNLASKIKKNSNKIINVLKQHSQRSEGIKCIYVSKGYLDSWRNAWNKCMLRTFNHQCRAYCSLLEIKLIKTAALFNLHTKDLIKVLVYGTLLEYQKNSLKSLPCIDWTLLIAREIWIRIWAYFHRFTNFPFEEVLILLCRMFGDAG